MLSIFCARISYFIESTNLMGLGQGRGVGGPAGGGGVGRGHTIGHGFFAGMLVGAAMTLYMTPECNDSSRSMHASTPNPSLSSSDTLPLASLLIADLHRCQAGLALEQNKRAILATNAAEVASRLEELRDEKGCDRACQQEYRFSQAQMQPEPMSNPPFVTGTVPAGPTDTGGQLTVATHVSFDRLTSLSQLCRLHPGRIAASVYVRAANLTDLSAWCDADQVCGCRKAGSRLTLRYTLHDALSDTYGQLYPVNSLRNQALAASNTEFTLGIDADFVIGGPTAIPTPAPGQVLIMPCFKVSDPDLRSGDESIAWPLTKHELLAWKTAGRVVAYDDPDWPLGHADVQYERWANTTAVYDVDRANVYFEPYFVARTNDLPGYDERYRGYGAGDKALHFHLLYKLGFDVKVLPDHFILHLPHKDNNWRGNAMGKTDKNIRDHFTQFHYIERMMAGVHQLDFWTRVVGNCAEAGCRQTYCSPLVPQLSGGVAKCRTQPDQYLTLPWNKK